VLRFNNHDVMTNKAGVLATIAAACGPAPSLTLPRKRGRGQGSANPQGSALNDQRNADRQGSADPRGTTSLQHRADGREQQ
jgi:hypothetical protein